MNWVGRKSCPLCGHSPCAPFRRPIPIPDQLQSEDVRITDSRYGKRWPLFRCPSCTFVFADPVPDSIGLAELYGNLQDDEYSGERENRARNFLPILSRIRRFSPAGKRLLDVGAASGIFLDLARRHGFAVEGVEPSSFLVREARELYDLELFCGTLDTFPERPQYDVVTLLDIIEHVFDPAGMLRQVHGRMNPGGLLVAVTPDISSLAANLTGEHWWHFRLAHLQFFNRRSLEHILRCSGFHPLAMRRYAWHFSYHYLLTRLFPRLKSGGGLQNVLKKLNLKLQLFDSLEIYARKI